MVTKAGPSTIFSSPGNPDTIDTIIAPDSANTNATNILDTGQDTGSRSELEQPRRRLWYKNKKVDIGWIYKVNICLGIVGFILTLPCFLVTMFVFTYSGGPSHEVKEKVMFRCFRGGYYIQKMLEFPACLLSTSYCIKAIRVSYCLLKKHGIGGFPYDESYILRLLQHNAVRWVMSSAVLIGYVLFILGSDFFNSSFVERMTFHINGTTDRERRDFIWSRRIVFQSYLTALLVFGIISLFAQLLFVFVMFFYRRDVLPYKDPEHLRRTPSPEISASMQATSPVGSHSQQSGGDLSTITAVEGAQYSPNNATSSESDQPFYAKFTEWSFSINLYFGFSSFCFGIFFAIMGMSAWYDLEDLQEVGVFGGNRVTFVVTHVFAGVWGILNFVGLILSEILLFRKRSIVANPSPQIQLNRRLCQLLSFLMNNIFAILTGFIMVIFVIVGLSGDLFSKAPPIDLPFTEQEANIIFNGSRKLIEEWKRNQTIISVRSTYSSAFTSLLVFGLISLSYSVVFTIMIGHYRLYLKKNCPPTISDVVVFVYPPRSGSAGDLHIDGSTCPSVRTDSPTSSVYPIYALSSPYTLIK